MSRGFTDAEIESILRSYKKLKLKVTADEEQLYGLYPSCVSQSDGQPKAMGGISRQTENFGIKNAAMREYLAGSVASIAKQVRIIELVFDALNADQRDFTKLYYLEQHTRQQVIDKLCIEPRTFDRIRRTVINDVVSMLVGISQKPIDFAV